MEDIFGFYNVTGSQTVHFKSAYFFFTEFASANLAAV